MLDMHKGQYHTGDDQQQQHNYHQDETMLVIGTIADNI
jgi:hypothetical protein